MKEFDPDYVFSHHHASPEQLKKFEAIHISAKEFSRTVLDSVPEGADRNAVLRLLREASMLACSAISLGGRFKE
jgi:hypothetical protein